ncbi:tryptophan-rich sensory protein [Calothrix sp. FACHB-1219]|uniref:tryptophan-rich sensory protein n=1 Tax=unclassified Calothrix TaxID=2619626 RepID=UPI0016851F90|nr:MULTISPECIES: tryptophan-rich sensory protein [unclassified Calothrix]MBD2202190.1 tryptophan-rich sensory protein [Calothrix sp. FACHB-168]MBD2217597.1 tryptophan-rich sensory protein [Calothrix sp. FACHB-1219]
MQQSTQGDNRDFIRQLATLAAIIGAFVVNVISNIFPLNGLSIGQISNTLFKNVSIIPANYAFAIWGLIYLGLFALGIYQFLPSQKEDADLRNTGYLLVIASIAQSIWVYLFLSRLFVLSVIAMLLILLPLIGIYLRLNIGNQHVSRQKKWYLYAPISIYLGWISVATIVNVACALYFQNWNGWGISAEYWTVILLAIASAIAATIVIQRRDIAYVGVTVWAILAIAVKHWNNPILRNVAIALVIALVVITIVKYVKQSIN